MAFVRKVPAQSETNENLSRIILGINARGQRSSRPCSKFQIQLRVIPITLSVNMKSLLRRGTFHFHVNGSYFKRMIIC